MESYELEMRSEEENVRLIHPDPITLTTSISVFRNRDGLIIEIGTESEDVKDKIISLMTDMLSAQCDREIDYREVHRALYTARSCVLTGNKVCYLYDGDEELPLMTRTMTLRFSLVLGNGVVWILVSNHEEEMKKIRMIRTKYGEHDRMTYPIPVTITSKMGIGKNCFEDNRVIFMDISNCEVERGLLSLLDGILLAEWDVRPENLKARIEHEKNHIKLNDTTFYVYDRKEDLKYDIHTMTLRLSVIVRQDGNIFFMMGRVE